MVRVVGWEPLVFVVEWGGEDGLGTWSEVVAAEVEDGMIGAAMLLCGVGRIVW